MRSMSVVVELSWNFLERGTYLTKHDYVIDIQGG